jgi:bacterioferritin-associated ferredoxin
LAKTIVCHCEDITLDELVSAVEQGYREIESLKRFAGIATGKCQGKCCVVQTLRFLASPAGREAIRKGIDRGPGTALTSPSEDELAAAIRLPTIRQPVTPLRIDDLVLDGGVEAPEGESE